MLRPQENLLCHPYGANSKYFKNAHAIGARQKRIMSAASTCVPEMLSSVVASRRANTLFTPAGLLENAGSLWHSSDLYMLGIWFAKNEQEKWLNRRDLEPS